MTTLHLKCGECGAKLAVEYTEMVPECWDKIDAAGWEFDEVTLCKRCLHSGVGSADTNRASELFQA